MAKFSDLPAGCQSCMVMHGAGDCLRLINLGPGFNSHQSFGQWSKILANLLNLLSRNLGKTPMSRVDLTCTALSR